MSKRYNPYKQAQKRFQYQEAQEVNNVAVVFVFGDKASYMWHRPTRQLIKPNQIAINAVINKAHKWNVGCVIAARTQFGEEWYRVWDVGPEISARHEQIAKSCTDKHLELLRTVPKPQRLNGMWIATPSGEMMERDELDDILDAVKIWDFISLYEDEKENQN